MNTVQENRYAGRAHCAQRRGGQDGPTGKAALEDEARKAPCGRTRHQQQQEQTLASVRCREAWPGRAGETVQGAGKGNSDPAWPAT